MKSIVIYSSLTGNTKQVAEAITSVLPEGTPCVAMSELPSDIESYDLVFAGFWVDRERLIKRPAMYWVHCIIRTLLCLQRLACLHKWNMLSKVLLMQHLAC